MKKDHLKPPVLVKKTSKQDRELKVLLGLVDYYIKTAKPVGSNSLKEAGFDDLSSATIRNYFANLESSGYLTQQHASGGRIPTAKAFRFYADFKKTNTIYTKEAEKTFSSFNDRETREIATFLQEAAEIFSQTTQCAVFLSTPRFDQDIIITIKLVPIDHFRCLGIVVTDFGLIHTEILTSDKKITNFTAKRIEEYFHWRLTGLNKPEGLTKEDEALAQRFYNEILVRYVVGYSNFSDADIYKTGFSKLLLYPEFHTPSALPSSLALFENTQGMRLLLKEVKKHNQTKVWIGDDLTLYTSSTPDCAILSAPYHINKQPVGAIGLLGPMRIPYEHLFDLMQAFTKNLSEALTRNIYKHKITFREPNKGEIANQSDNPQLLCYENKQLLENKMGALE